MMVRGQDLRLRLYAHAEFVHASPQPQEGGFRI